MSEIPLECPLKDYCKNLREENQAERWFNLTSDDLQAERILMDNFNEIVKCLSQNYHECVMRIIAEKFVREVDAAFGRIPSREN